jgi:hypothetical protein
VLHASPRGLVTPLVLLLTMRLHRRALLYSTFFTIRRTESVPPSQPGMLAVSAAIVTNRSPALCAYIEIPKLHDV